MDQEIENIEENKRRNLAIEAHELLSNPLLANFFKEQESQCFEAFKQLPIDSNIEEYRIVHHALLAGGQLKKTLQIYVQRAETDVFDRKQQDDLPGDIEV